MKCYQLVTADSQRLSFLVVASGRIKIVNKKPHFSFNLNSKHSKSSTFSKLDLTIKMDRSNEEIEENEEMEAILIDKLDHTIYYLPNKEKRSP